MDFVVLSREEIEQGILLRSPYVVISIADPESPSPTIRKDGLCQGILRLRFHDAEPSEAFTLPPNVKIMSGRQALAVWRFVNRHVPAVQNIVVHCEAGMSRSPAVAAAICKGLGGDDAQFWREFQPNEYIYELMLETAPGHPS